MAAKFFAQLPLAEPNPACVHGDNEAALATLAAGARPRADIGHSKVERGGTSVPVPTPVRFPVPYGSETIA